MPVATCHHRPLQHSLYRRTAGLPAIHAVTAVDVIMGIHLAGRPAGNGSPGPLPRQRGELRYRFSTVMLLAESIVAGQSLPGADAERFVDHEGTMPFPVTL